MKMNLLYPVGMYAFWGGGRRVEKRIVVDGLPVVVEAFRCRSTKSVWFNARIEFLAKPASADCLKTYWGAIYKTAAHFFPIEACSHFGCGASGYVSGSDSLDVWESINRKIDNCDWIPCDWDERNAKPEVSA